MSTTTKPTVRKPSRSSRTAADWERAYVASFLEKYCSDEPTDHADAAVDPDYATPWLAPMTERERIIAEELNAKLELPETPEPAPAATEAPTTPKPAGAVLFLAYLAIALALATSALVLVTR